MLRVVTSENKTTKHQEQLAERMYELADSIEEATIGFQGGSRDETVWYYEDAGFWFISSTDVLSENRYWNPFGLHNPRTNKNVHPNVEIFIPFTHDRAITGVFLVDDDDKVYLGHRGRVNGVKMESFFKDYIGSVKLVEDDGRSTEIAIITSLESESILSNIRLFIDEIARLKEIHKGKTTAESSTRKRSHTFEDENESRKPYEQSEVIEADLIHGRVVNELRRQLSNKGYQVENTQQIDLLIADESDEVTHLFEAKSSYDTQSFYTAIGQLMFHTVDYPSAHKILVIPNGLNAEYKRRIRGLGIKILTYRIKPNGISFSDFASVGILPSNKKGN